MASDSDTEDVGLKLMTQMKEFPHFTHLNIPGLTQERLRGILENLEEESDSDDLCIEETISKLNFKSWVLTKLENHRHAEEINKRVILMTNWQNIVSIGNCVFLSWHAGREMEALDCASRLQKMKREPNFYELSAFAKAELAYSYSRVGGPRNLSQAINILEEFIQSYPNKFLWKLRLGLVYRRSTHLNIYSVMLNKPTLLELIQKAVDLLTVIVKSADDQLRGPACSELAVLCKQTMNVISKEEHSKMFNNKKANDLCKEALSYDNSSTWVLTNCGKVLWPKEAIPILLQCLSIRKHTTTYHQLGICYVKEAVYESKHKLPTRSCASQQSGRRQEARYKINKSSPRGPIHPCSSMYPTTEIYQIILPNKNFNKAENEFQNAIKMSHNKNLPAIFSLGTLYLSAGKKHEALEKFNWVTNNGTKEHLVTIIKAYEQAGLIYSDMKDCETLAEDKLTKAISLAVTAASSCPQLQDYAQKMWDSFRTTKDKWIEEQHSPAIDFKLIKMYELLKNYHSVVKVVEKLLNLNDSQLKDIRVIISGLNGYLELKEPEKALIFLNAISTMPDVASAAIWTTDAMMKMRFKVYLRVVEYRLKVQRHEARFVFQELFKLKYGECTGDVSEDTIYVPNIQDVLFIYDEDNDTEEGLSQTSKIVQAIQEICSEIFGLNTCKNLQGCIDYGYMLPVQLEQMKKYRVVVVVLGEENRGNDFEALLKMIPSVEAANSESMTVLVIDTCRESNQVPDFLRHYGCYKLHEDLSSLIPRTEGGAYCGGNTLLDQNVLGNFEGKNLDILMKLFCFIIGHINP